MYTSVTSVYHERTVPIEVPTRHNAERSKNTPECPNVAVVLQCTTVACCRLVAGYSHGGSSQLYAAGATKRGN